MDFILHKTYQLRLLSLQRRCLKCISEYVSDYLKCLSIGTPKTINFPFVPNGKLMVLGVPISEHLMIRL